MVRPADMMNPGGEKLEKYDLTIVSGMCRICRHTGVKVAFSGLMVDRPFMAIPICEDCASTIALAIKAHRA